MALATLGTAATTTLQALLVSDNMAAADVAALAALIKDDSVNSNHMIIPGAFSQTRQLFIPRRGVIKCISGDYIGVDGNGFPILISANSAGGASWVHT